MNKGIAEKAAKPVGKKERARRDRATAVAQDVLKQLRRKTKRLKVDMGNYLAVSVDSGFFVPEDAEDLRDFVDDLQPECTVCALGACLLSKARLYDEVPKDVVAEPTSWLGFRFRYAPQRNVVTERLADLFTEQQMSLIEAAFEQTSYIPGFVGAHSRLVKAREFAREIDDPAKRLAAIMRNIIENDGVFVVPEVEE